MKMTYFEHIPDTCDNCIYYSCKPHPYKGWSDVCELCGCCMDDDQEDDWIYDGDSRPKNCPLMEIQTGAEPQTGHWVDDLIAKILEEVDGGTDDRYIRYNDICDRVTKSIKEYFGQGWKG